MVARAKPAKPKSPRSDAEASFRPVARGHAADPIFEQLAAAILRGELTPGDPLPPERVLADQFGVSRIVLRQAVHRLADAQLVRVRQGGATVILDPAEAGDLRVLALYYFLDPGGAAAKAIRRDAVEKQFLQGLSLIDVCGRRGSIEEKRSLHERATAFDDRHASEADFAAFEESFWRAVARAGKNRIFGMEVAWWYGTLGESRPKVAEAKADGASSSIAVRIAFYRELARLLVAGESATAYYLAVTSPQLDALFAGESPR